MCKCSMVHIVCIQYSSWYTFVLYSFFRVTLNGSHYRANGLVILILTLTLTLAGCIQLLEILEIYRNLKTLLEILEISWNLKLEFKISWNIGPPGNLCVRCRRSTSLASSHKTGYQITCLRNWSPYFIFAMAPCNRFGTLHRRPKQGKHDLDFS